MTDQLGPCECRVEHVPYYLLCARCKLMAETWPELVAVLQSLIDLWDDTRRLSSAVTIEEAMWGIVGRASTVLAKIAEVRDD